jgi:hypothetical protein
MLGEIASLIQDNKQVGGLFNWSISLVEDLKVENGWRKGKPIKRFSAESYWLLETPKSDLFEVKFYQAIGDNLFFVAREKLKLNFPSLTLDKKLKDPVFI